MQRDANILIYCRAENPGRVERLSLRLRSFLHRYDRAAEMLSVFGDQVFREDTLAVGKTPLKGRTLLFSRYTDLRDLGWSWLGARIVYWRHEPVIQTGFDRLLEIGFIAFASRRGRIICSCDELAADICALPFVKETSVSTCYTPVGKDIPMSVPMRMPQTEAPKLCFFGRPGTQKRLDAALWQFAELRRSRPEAELHVYGYELTPDIIGATEGVTFHGISRNTTAALEAADALLLLSDYEGFPSILIEAALAGTPIICNDFHTGRLDFERIVGDVMVIDPSDPDALLQALDAISPGEYALDGLSDSVLAVDWLVALDPVHFDN